MWHYDFSDDACTPLGGCRTFLALINVITKTTYHSHSYNSPNSVILVYSAGGLLQLRLCMIRIFRGAVVVTPSKPPPPYKQLLPLPTPCFKMFLERSLNDPPPPHFKHLSLLPPSPSTTPFPPKNFDYTPCSSLFLQLIAASLLPASTFFGSFVVTHCGSCFTCCGSCFTCC